jgi:uncharacterized protein YukJ
MPLAHYGVLKGKVIGAKREDDQSTPHYQVHILAGTAHNRIAINAKSQASPSDLLFLVDDNFQHPLTAHLPDMAQGFTPLPRTAGSQGLDYVRGNLFNRLDMRPLPSTLPGPDNDLSDQLEHFVKRAIQEPDATIYAFGQRWGPEPKIRDKIFDFLPGLGIHDIHMNQGNVVPFLADDGVWQDGGLLLQFTSTQQWVAIFWRFSRRPGIRTTQPVTPSPTRRNLITRSASSAHWSIRRGRDRSGKRSPFSMLRQIPSISEAGRSPTS